MEKNFYDIYQKYMSMTKEELAALLTSKEMLETNFNFNYEITDPLPQPCYLKRCMCTNPFHDCINCPYQTTGGWDTSLSSNVPGKWNTSSSSSNEDESIINKLRKMAEG